MNIIKALLQMLLKFTRVSFVAVGLLMEYISKEIGKSAKESAKPSNLPRIWWW